MTTQKKAKKIAILLIICYLYYMIHQQSRQHD